MEADEGRVIRTNVGEYLPSTMPRALRLRLITSPGATDLAWVDWMRRRGIYSDVVGLVAPGSMPKGLQGPLVRPNGRRPPILIRFAEHIRRLGAVFGN